jgi:hypothetical protein
MIDRKVAAVIRWLMVLGIAATLEIWADRSPAIAQDASDVAKVIVPFVEKHCAHCHGEKKPKGDVSLHLFKDEASILKGRKTWIRVLEQLHSGEMPPQGRPKPAFDEAERFNKAVRGIFERFDRTAKRDPGVVTMRRLNRAEYVNTVRDLVGVTIPLAEDFPADQMGHGFDNIGDVLTLSPLQLERYLASAEAIVKAAIVVGEPPAPASQQHNGSARFDGPSYGPKYDDRGRLQLDAKGAKIPEKERLPAIPGDSFRILYDKGPLQKRFDQLLDRGEYKLIAKLQGLFVGDEPPKFALVVDGKQVMQGVCSEKADEYAVTIRLTPGAANLGVSLRNEYTDPADPKKRRGIVLHSLKLVSPAIPESHEQFFAGSEKLTGDAKTRFVLERFATHAYRRPATKEEVDRLLRIVHQAEKISHYKLTAESLGKLQAAKIPADVIGRLKAMEKDALTDEERFVKSLRQRLTDEMFQKHLTAILEAAEKIPQPWEGQIGLAMKAVLCSPKFLYRVELDARPTEKDAHPIDDYQLASRLSYFLWSTMPDQELFDLAAKNQLHQNLPAQVKRMAADPRSKALFDNFATQWLGLRRLQEFTPGPQALDFSKLSGGGNWADLRGDMLTETGLFFSEIVREDRSIFDLIDARFTYINQRLAQLYDIGDTNGNSAQSKGKPINPLGKPIPSIQVLERGQDSGTVVRTYNPFVRVNLENTRRGGILTQASVLAVTSHPTRTSLVKRGHWVLEQILGTPPPPPPPNVPSLEETKSDKPLSVRQQVEQHRKNPNCAGCHARMDPIGFAFENFDVLGRYRQKDGDQPIDAAGELPNGKKFNGPDELKAILKGEKELFSRNLTEKLLVYATGRGLDFYDRRTVDGILVELQKNDYRFHALITAIVQSDAFRMRRGKEQP